MENGLKVASSDLPSPSATIGLYVEAGSAFDEIPGTAHLIQHMAFKSSSSVSQLKMTTVLESLGAATSSLSSRENIVFQIDTLKSSVPQLVGLLAETSLAPKFHSWEVEEAHAAVKAELQELQQNPQALLQEMSHAAAYGRGSPLGQPAMCPPGNLSAVSPAVLQKFAADNMVPNRMVLAAAGYDHAELVSLAQATFGKAAGGAPPHSTASAYTGGEVREASDEPISHFALAFEGVGWKDDALVPLCVLNTLMGGGASFSAGGPGKGMYTRLYQNILNRFGFAQSASVFNAPYPSANANPDPDPNPSPYPNPNPSPSPTPRPNQVFNALALALALTRSSTPSTMARASSASTAPHPQRTWASWWPRSARR